VSLREGVITDEYNKAADAFHQQSTIVLLPIVLLFGPAAALNSGWREL
jgi:hypothetical protein